MKKLKRIRLTLVCPGMFAFYLDELLGRGLYGDTRSEVACNLLGNALLGSLSGDTIRKLVEQRQGKK